MKKKRSNLPLWIVLGAGFATVAYGVGPGAWFRAPAESAIEGMRVQRGDLLVSEVVRGNLMAKDSVSIKNELEGRTTILFLVDEGTRVAAGDLIAELDVASLEDNLVAQRIQSQNAEADFTKAREQYDIQVLQNESDIALAELAAVFAEKDLEKYQVEEGEWEHELQKAEETIVLREEELARAQDRLEFTKKLHEEGFVQRTELESDQASFNRASIELEQARRERALKLKYEHERRLAELQSDLETKQREVEKVRKQALARLADYEAARESARFKRDLERQKLEKLENQIGKAKIHSPVDGMVVYARERSRWGSGEPVYEGAEVRERQEIVTIPRTGGMIVESSLHETVLKKVDVGMPCTISIDALPARVFRGRVDFVALLPDSNAWFANPNQRLYRSEIAILDPVPEMRPGMSCSVEIHAAELEDVLYVPIQAVFLDGGRLICFVREAAGVHQRPVEVGLDNSTWVVIEKGLEERELVLLSPPPGFNPAPSERRGPRLPGEEDEPVSGEEGALGDGLGGPPAFLEGGRDGGDGPGGGFPPSPPSNGDPGAGPAGQGAWSGRAGDGPGRGGAGEGPRGTGQGGREGRGGGDAREGSRPREGGRGERGSGGPAAPEDGAR